MENSVMDKILRAEKRAADIENMSNKRAAERISSAKQQGELIIKNAKNQGDSILNERIILIKTKIQELENESMEKTSLDIRLITEEAVKKFPEAIKRVNEILIFD